MNNNYEYNGLVYQSLVSSIMPESTEQENYVSEDLGPMYQSPDFVVEPVRYEPDRPGIRYYR